MTGPAGLMVQLACEAMGRLDDALLCQADSDVPVRYTLG